jgi:hypothetical protein
MLPSIGGGRLQIAGRAECNALLGAVAMVLFTLHLRPGPHQFEGWFRDGDGSEGRPPLERAILTTC